MSGLIMAASIGVFLIISLVAILFHFYACKACIGITKYGIDAAKEKRTSAADTTVMGQPVNNFKETV